MLQAALRYAALDEWHVFPCSRDKNPLVKSDTPGEGGLNLATRDMDKIRAWWTKWGDASIGINLGLSGLAVIDVDGPEGQAALDALKLPPTREVTTGRDGGGTHHYYRIPAGSQVDTLYLPPELELRSSGAYVIAPPSVHASGRVYTANDAEIQILNGDAIARLRSIAKPNGKAPPIPAEIPSGDRNAILTSLAGTMRRRGASEAAILAALKQENTDRCKPPLPDDEVAAIARSIARKPPSEKPDTTRETPIPRGPDPTLPDDLAKYVRRFVVLGMHELVAVVLWIVHTHAIDACDTTGYLNVTSPEKASGKTRLLEVLEFLVRDSWLAASTTAAALVRKVDHDSPTLLLDEVDALMKGDKERAEAIRGILNAGYRRSGKCTTCIGQGKDITFRDWRVFGAKALTGIGGLHDTLASRCIPIALKKRRDDEHIERFREREQRAPATELHDRAASWVAEHFDELQAARPELPDDLSDRASDIWEPLLAIADVFGADWPALARVAAARLANGGNGDDDSKGVELLRDIRTVFNGHERLWTGDLLARLIAIDEAPWGDLYGKRLDAASLARRLKGYKVKSKDLRIGSDVKKGFERAAFEDAWARYLPAQEAPDAAL
jgi:hypothetical protein